MQVTHQVYQLSRTLILKTILLKPQPNGIGFCGQNGFPAKSFTEICRAVGIKWKTGCQYTLVSSSIFNLKTCKICHKFSGFVATTLELLSKIIV